ncbi:MAG TPA: M13 family metallopeptidase [Terriglobales bacterium]|jgi:putative endopeptidase|nr:M13 family metallopeptidase [Terriglobales bacterium]
MMRHLSAIVVVLLCSVSGIIRANAQSAPVSPSTPKLEHFDISQVDKTLDPCQDFYQYACSKWNAANPIPADQVAWGTGSGLQYWNENILREALEKAATQTSNRTDYEQKIGDYWAACMDESGIESAGTRDLKAELERIAQMTNKSQLADQVAHIHQAVPGAWQGDDNQTRAALLGFGQQQDFDDATKVVAAIDQGGLGLPNRDFYIKDDAKSKEIRGQYETHISKMLALSGESPEQAATDAKTIIAIETAMAQAQMDNVARRDPKNLNNKMSLEQVQALTPSFDWKGYIEVVAAPPSSPHYIVTSPQFFRSLEPLIQKHSVDDWKVYLRWHLVHGSAPYLDKAFVDENWNFYSHTLLGAKQQLPRWRRCVRAADRDLGMALGQAYVAAAFPPESKQRTVTMVHDIEHAMDQDITNIDWMQPVTKEQAKIKLKAVYDKIGYPDHWRDYSSVKVGRNSYLNNVHEATAFEFHRQLDKIGKPVDREEWGMTPPTINAYYDPQLNSINFPAGILQPPYFDSTMGDPVNYGAIGMVIGHELTHGFDDEGRKFDAQGNLRDWWTPEDAKAYEQRGECIANEYTEEIPEAGVKQNGHLTQGEDTADNGGLRLAFMAVNNNLQAEGKSLDAKEADGWTPRQKFFVSYAYSWCEQVRPELMRTLVLTNPHSIPKYRVNNVVSNMPEFQEAFTCKKGSPMVRANQCRVW